MKNFYIFIIRFFVGLGFGIFLVRFFYPKQTFVYGILLGIFLVCMGYFSEFLNKSKSKQK